MARDLTIVLENRPGTVADAGEAFGRAGVNLAGACGFASDGQGILHVLVDDADAETAANAAREAGLDVRDEREVLVVPIQDQPGTLGSLARGIANAGVNLDLLYLTMDGRVVIGADDLEKARAAL